MGLFMTSLSHLSHRVESLLNSMTLEEKVGQIFVFTFISQAQALRDLRYSPGGYIRIYSDTLSVARQNVQLQQGSRIPLIMAADFERGIGMNVSGAIDVMTMMALGATDNPENAFTAASIISAEASAMGINMNYVPVLDVNNNPKNPIINTRSFGADPHKVAAMGVQFVKGTQVNNVASCGKHFPGHGDTTVDSHTDLGVIAVNRDRLEAVELVPFKAAIAAGVDAIMSAHLHIPALDPEPVPATLSRRILTDFLRGELGFRGVVVSDALDMGAIAKNFPPEVSIPKAINAGCDQLIMPTDNDRAFNILRNAVIEGTVSEERLNEAVGRILTMKENRGILDGTLPDLATLAEKTFTYDHRIEALRIAREAVTLIKDEKKLLPLQPQQGIACFTLANSEDGRAHYLEPKTFPLHLEMQSLLIRTENLGNLAGHNALTPERQEQIDTVINRSDVIVVCAYLKVVINRGTMDLEQRYVDFMESLRKTGKPIVLVSLGSPWLYDQFPYVDAFVCGYAATEPVQQATAEILAGNFPFKGKPVYQVS